MMLNCLKMFMCQLMLFMCLSYSTGSLSHDGTLPTPTARNQGCKAVQNAEKAANAPLQQNGASFGKASLDASKTNAAAHARTKESLLEDRRRIGRSLILSGIKSGGATFTFGDIKPAGARFDDLSNSFSAGVASTSGGSFVGHSFGSHSESSSFGGSSSFQKEFGFGNINKFGSLLGTQADNFGEASRVNADVGSSFGKEAFGSDFISQVAGHSGAYSDVVRGSSPAFGAGSATFQNQNIESGRISDFGTLLSKHTPIVGSNHQISASSLGIGDHQEDTFGSGHTNSFKSHSSSQVGAIAGSGHNFEEETFGSGHVSQVGSLSDVYTGTGGGNSQEFGTQRQNLGSDHINNFGSSLSSHMLYTLRANPHISSSSSGGGRLSNFGSDSDSQIGVIVHSGHYTPIGIVTHATGQEAANIEKENSGAVLINKENSAAAFIKNENSGAAFITSSGRHSDSYSGNDEGIAQTKSKTSHTFGAQNVDFKEEILDIGNTNTQEKHPNSLVGAITSTGNVVSGGSAVQVLLDNNAANSAKGSFESGRTDIHSNSHTNAGHTTDETASQGFSLGSSFGKENINSGYASNFGFNSGSSFGTEHDSNFGSYSSSGTLGSAAINDEHHNVLDTQHTNLGLVQYSKYKGAAGYSESEFGSSSGYQSSSNYGSTSVSKFGSSDFSNGHGALMTGRGELEKLNAGVFEAIKLGAVSGGSFLGSSSKQSNILGGTDTKTFAGGLASVSKFGSTSFSNTHGHGELGKLHAGFAEAINLGSVPGGSFQSSSHSEQSKVFGDGINILDGIKKTVDTKTFGPTELTGGSRSIVATKTETFGLGGQDGVVQIWKK